MLLHILGLLKLCSILTLLALILLKRDLVLWGLVCLNLWSAIIILFDVIEGILIVTRSRLAVLVLGLSRLSFGQLVLPGLELLFFEAVHRLENLSVLCDNQGQEIREVFPNDHIS